jgi:hypothetical protein
MRALSVWAACTHVRDGLIEQREQRRVHIGLLVELRMQHVVHGLGVWDVAPRVRGEIHDERFPRLRDAEVELVVLHLGLHAADVHETTLRVEAAEREVVLGDHVLIVAGPLAARAGHLLHPEADEAIQVTGERVERERLKADELLIGTGLRRLVRILVEAWSLEIAVATSGGEHAGGRDHGERGGNANAHGPVLR